MLAPAIAPAPLIEDRPELEAAVARLRAHTRLACDTESNSLHAYRGRTCLIQISSPDEDLLIDPLAIADMSPLAPLFADPAIEKIFHAAEYDLICLKRDFDFDVHNVFDTMAAGRVCGYQRFGLSHMLADKLGVQHPKRHQRDNWGRRPLPESYRRYAQMDTHYLLPLRDALYAELEAAGRLEEAGEYFSDILNFELKPQEFDPEGFWALYRPNSLNRAQLAVLRELYILREELAKSVDHPSHRLISNKTLLQIVKTLPRRRSQLARIRNAVQIYKNVVRPIHPTSRIYHHTPVVKGFEPRGWGVLELAARDRTCTVTGLFRLSDPAEAAYLLRLRGIDPARRYQVIFDNSSERCELDGFTLTRTGIPVHLDAALTSELLIVEAVD